MEECHLLEGSTGAKMGPDVVIRIGGCWRGKKEDLEGDKADKENEGWL